MPSLFSRSHHAPKKDRAPPVLVANNGQDRKVLGLAKTWNGSSAAPNSSSVSEFGTVPQHLSPGHLHGATLPRSPDGMSQADSSVSLLPMQYSFVTTQIPQGAIQQLSGDSMSTYGDDTTRHYGFLGGVGRTVVLGLNEVARVIRDVGAELGRRALGTPMLFSNQSLELSQTRMRMLIQAFLATIRSGPRVPTKTSLATFDQDIRFASDHELAWLLRWALSRLTRIREGTREVCHGCFEWDMYEEWRGREKAAKYPLDAFNQLQSILPPDVYNHIVEPLFSLLSRFTAHSHNSGLTPHALASIFAALLFDIPANSPCLVAHATFVRAASATEHMLLSYIRSTGKRDDLGLSELPSRLREWVKGYPSMVASDADLARAMPRKGARAVRCHVATRSVRAYSRDLVVSAETWRDDVPTGWNTWDLVLLKSRRGDAGRPKFSTPWRRKMMVKETLPLPASSNSSNKQPLAYGAPLQQSQPRSSDKDEGDVGKYSSLAGQEWSAFEDMGFDMPKQAKSWEQQKDERDISQRLQFDLNESAKHSVTERRQTMDWSEFASGGFTRTENYLTASLTFSAPVQSSITEWPKERDELRRRLQKTQKEATPFNHDTTPRVGRAANMEGADNKGRIYVEEAFVDCWADFMMGGAWTDREELTFKEASWALIEYKSRPERTDEDDAPHPSIDPRTTDVYFLFEERVPLDYQMAVADPKRKKSLHTIFKRKKEKAGSPSGFDSRVNDFDRMLNRGLERKLTLSRNDQSVSSSLWHSINDGTSKAGSMTTSTSTTSTIKPSKSLQGNKSTGKALPSTPRGMTPASQRSPPKSAPTPQEDQAKPSNGRSGLFKKSIRRVKSGTDQRKEAKKQREVCMDFEIQTASGVSSGANSPQDSFHGGADDKDKWMDILIANGARPMNREVHLQPSTSREPERSPSAGSRQLTPSNDITPTATALGGLNIVADGHAHPVLGSPMQLSTRTGSGSHQGSGSSTDHRGVEFPEGNTAIDANSQSSIYDESHRSSVLTDDNSVQPSDSISMRRHARESSPPPEDELTVGDPNRNTAHLAYDEIVSPKPRMAGDRDAIFSIVDHYGDQAGSHGTESSSSEDVYGGIVNRDSVIEDTYTSERVNSAYDGIERNSVIEEKYAAERLNSAYSVDDTFPPPPIFDLTPGREPSPARYKHGEPLHFVGEEDEEDEYL
ncbi:hypothetical protein CcaverHIS002_0700300 [Cutaneotrichosporon cavernicola]|uniref:Meiotically up-regulated protein Msb1/Mug8 domain-containing protein n=1 Tax=Cutaneotrichosporon cavernicola TaxID=279322 RepID=A0AA48QYL0_9TREE|nr:uncharacterized protein CcaverHIS019_0700300 [Cutaneotrichosporon cavernicola]BEI86684.1 hypothetical protein CcaverHIS002_0700300 [Cutaneotrichosporon cavernicola]BEI94458.1 hypothetical protein CcaverHIS019_0700300 [Cutaneotrichosporon cavernicola]BEJ02235.1 hypothetical protein CcaverHIS631_0700300 [Cutaneotrichosporon cavernicola]BEJ09994.1 hypothetical protein CcaverHIS641_0700290 [Cutaneotrichosporon cavernicola]